MLEHSPLKPDRELVQEIAGGDSHAAQELHRRHSGTLYALAYGVLIDSDSADQVVNQTFDHVRREAARFDPATGPAHSWLSAIARALARTLADERRTATSH